MGLRDLGWKTTFIIKAHRVWTFEEDRVDLLGDGWNDRAQMENMGNGVITVAFSQSFSQIINSAGRDSTVAFRINGGVSGSHLIFWVSVLSDGNSVEES